MAWRLLGALPILALLSCSTAPEMDPIEAKAAAGDPVAACQFAARNLHACALEKQKWERSALAIKPACLAAPIGEKAEGYLDAVQEKLKTTSATGSPIVKLSSEVAFLTTRISLSVSELVVTSGAADNAVKTTADLSQQCIDLNGAP